MEVPTSATETEAWANFFRRALVQPTSELATHEDITKVSPEVSLIYISSPLHIYIALHVY